jgi:peptidyl-prolyl cis-trans isomerase SurA
MRGPASFLLAAFILTNGLTVALRAHAQVIERVVAVVDDDPIFLSDVRREAAPFLARATSLPTGERRVAISAIYDRALEALIDRRLTERRAAAEGIEVTEADLDRAMDEVVRSTGPSLGAWSASSWAPVREEVRRELLRYRVLNALVRSRITIDEEDVRARYRELARAAESTGEAMPPYEEVAEDVYREMLGDALERQEEALRAELRRRAVIERREAW